MVVVPDDWRALLLHHHHRRLVVVLPAVVRLFVRVDSDFEKTRSVLFRSSLILAAGCVVVGCSLLLHVSSVLSLLDSHLRIR